jgi:integrase
LPLPKKDIGRRDFARLINTAKVRRITFHGLRHTSATLLLSLGQPVHVVAQRLAHDLKETMNTYAHVLPAQQRTAAQQLGALLHR